MFKFVQIGVMFPQYESFTADSEIKAYFVFCYIYKAEECC